MFESFQGFLGSEINLALSRTGTQTKTNYQLVKKRMQSQGHYKQNKKSKGCIFVLISKITWANGVWEYGQSWSGQFAEHHQLDDQSSREKEWADREGFEMPGSAHLIAQ